MCALKYLIIPFLYFTIISCDGAGKQDVAAKKGPQIFEKIAGDIHYGTDVCSQSGKIIEVVRYGAVLQTKNGERLKFNSAESMAMYIQTERIDSENIQSMFVVDFADGDALIPVKSALYLHSTLRPSPGKMHITPINRDNKKMLDYVYNAYPGTYIEWDEIVERVRLTASK